MSQFQFTPGPWGYSVAPCGYVYVITQAANDYIRVETTNEANARLIAAAPELLAALQMADEWIREAKNAGCPLPSEVTLWQTRSAIAKATGETA